MGWTTLGHWSLPLPAKQASVAVALAIATKTSFGHNEFQQKVLS